jgi:peroxiredoxin
LQQIQIGGKMARTESSMLALGTKLPNFTLTDGLGQELISSVEEGTKNGTLVMFICNHCPFVIHVAKEIASIGKDFLAKGIRIIAINSNDIENYPEDSPEKMLEFKESYSFNFPYLFDKSQAVAKSFKAACTPDFYLFDKNDLLVYRGQLDDSRPENDVEVNGNDLRKALDALIENTTILGLQKPSIGCNIKWKA